MLTSAIRVQAHATPDFNAAAHAGHSPKQNHLLAALPHAEYARLAAQMDLVELPLGSVVCESGCVQEYAYFPTTAMVSLLCVTADGCSTEMAVVGNEGMAGVSMLLGGDRTPHRLVVQCAGHAYRLRGSSLKEEFNRAGPVHGLLLRYTQALITQTGQTAVCNRHHSVEEQLCRRLLSSLDRAPSNEVVVTQERIANMLGVRREGVTEAAGRLQKAGLIHYHRGHISILNRGRLEALACECYGVVKREFERLLPEAVTH